MEASRGGPNLEKVRGPKGGAHKGGSKPTLAILNRPTLAKPTLANVNCSGFFVCVELSWVVRRVGVRSKGGVRRMGDRRVGAQNVALFFPSPATKFVLFFPHTNTHKHTQTHTKTHKDTQRHTKTHKNTQHTTHNKQHTTPTSEGFLGCKSLGQHGRAKSGVGQSGLGQKWSDLQRAKSGTGQKWCGPIDGPKVVIVLGSIPVLLIQPRALIPHNSS